MIMGVLYLHVKCIVALPICVLRGKDNPRSGGWEGGHIQK